MNEIKSTLRRLRIIQLSVLGFLVMSACFAEVSFHGTSSHWSWQHSLMAGLASFCLFEGLYLRHRFLVPAALALAGDIKNPRALKSWEAWQVMSVAVAGSVAMYGVVVRTVFRGATWQAFLFYSVGLLLLLLWVPRMPPKVG